MSSYKDFYKSLKKQGLSDELNKLIKQEMELIENKSEKVFESSTLNAYFDIYFKHNDFTQVIQQPIPSHPPHASVKTLDELLENDRKREQDGLPRRIKIGKLVKPSKDNKGQVIIVPSTTEPKFYHDDSITEDGEGGETGGAGEGEEGEVIGQQQAQPEQGEGDASGAGQGEGGDHDVSQDAFDLGKIITEKFELPNVKDKGKKVSMTKFIYDLTDRNRGFGQLLDKKATIKKIIQTNILLGNIKENEPFDPTDLVINPQDQIFRLLSKEKDFENQAVVFFIRDYSGSMQGKPTEVVTTQHLLIYSWLMYQFQNNVMTRFILHDTTAKEVPDFYTYFRSQIAGGTNVHPAFDMVNEIVEKEQLAKDYSIYIFHGTDGDDWDESGTKMIEAINKMFPWVSRIGITVAKNAWGGDKATYVENYIEKSGLLKEKSELLRLDAFNAESASEERIIDSIKKLIS
ncbi:MAG: DUF444 family protein [Bacteroidota bacterium]